MMTTFIMAAEGDGSTTSYIVTIVVALASSTGGWGLLQWIFNRSGRKAEAAKAASATEQAKLDSYEAEARRQQMLAEIQNRAQQIAVESATSAYTHVDRELTSCRTELREMRRATEALIRVIEDLVATMQLEPDHLTRLRTAIAIARDNL